MNVRNLIDKDKIKIAKIIQNTNIELIIMK